VTAPTDQLDERLQVLPDDVLDDLVRLNSSSFRLTLVPGYRQDALFGRPAGTAYPWVLTASGTSRTGPDGTFSLSVPLVVRSAASGEPAPGGLLVPVVSGSGAVVPGPRLRATALPVTVVTAADPRPTVFTARALDVTDVPTSDPGAPIHAGWTGGLPETASTAGRVVVTGFGLDGEPAPRALFHWVLTVEMRREVTLGG
jgi:hypothetical protein